MRWVVSGLMGKRDDKVQIRNYFSLSQFDLIRPHRNARVSRAREAGTAGSILPCCNTFGLTSSPQILFSLPASSILTVRANNLARDPDFRKGVSFPTTSKSKSRALRVVTKNTLMYLHLQFSSPFHSHLSNLFYPLSPFPIPLAVSTPLL